MEERIKIGPETRCHQLDVTALYGHHEWRDSCMREHVVLKLFHRNELVKSLNIARTAGEMKRRSPIIIRQVDVGAKANNLLYIRGATLARDEHQSCDTAVLDRLIDWQQLLKDLNHRFYLALVDRCHDNSLSAKTFAAAVFNHLKTNYKSLYYRNIITI